MNRKLLLSICLITTLTLTACGNKGKFAPQIAVEQVLQNIANASASANGAIDLDNVSLGNDTGNATATNNSGAVASDVTGDSIDDGTVAENVSDAEVIFDSQVVVPEKQEASLLSKLISKIFNPKKPVTEPAPEPTPTPSKNNSSKKETTPTTPAPTTPSVEEKQEPAPEIKEEVKEEVKEEPKEEVKEEIVEDTKEETPSDEIADVEETKDDSTEEKPTKEEVVESEEPAEPAEPEVITHTPITVLIINECGAEITVVSVINPKTNEQINLGTLGVDEMFILKAEWPSNGKNFRVAGYGADGKIIMDKAFDFRAITQSAAIIFTGEGSLTDITYEVE